MFGNVFIKNMDKYINNFILLNDDMYMYICEVYS